jgi:hypothetical protein
MQLIFHMTQQIVLIAAEEFPTFRLQKNNTRQEIQKRMEKQQKTPCPCGQVRQASSSDCPDSAYVDTPGKTKK